MAKVLLGWEFGAGRGHYLTLKACADALAGLGHEPVFAVKNPAPFAAEGLPVWQAPVSPRLLVGAASLPRRSPGTMGDILARLGFDDPAIVAGLMLGWRQLIDAVQPDFVIGDFAPLLLAAARGRCPTIHLGTGFAMPPSDMAAYPSLTGEPQESSEQATLAATNRGLTQAGFEPISALPALFQANAEIVQTFEELDPYRQHRRTRLRPPMVSGWQDAAAGGGDELFVYLPESIAPDAALWGGLAASGLPVRIHLTNASPALLAVFEAARFTIELEPVPFERIAGRSRLVLSHGGHGFVCSALLAGLPQVICYWDLEKRLHANSVAAMGLGGHVGINSIEPQAFAASLVNLYEDAALAERASAAAPGFRARMTATLPEIICDQVKALLGA